MAGTVTTLCIISGLLLTALSTSVCVLQGEAHSESQNAIINENPKKPDTAQQDDLDLSLKSCNLQLLQVLLSLSCLILLILLGSPL